MAKAYAELEKKQSQGRKADDDDDAESAGETPQATEEERKAAEEATKKAGLDLQKVSQEWYENEGLTEETYGKLRSRRANARRIDSRSYTAGQTKGRTIQINRPLNG